MFPARSSGRGATSIYSLLNHNRTAMGKRMLRSWLKQPLTDVAAIQERHAVVQAFVEDDEMRCDLWDASQCGCAPLLGLCCWASAAGPLVQLCISAGLMGGVRETAWPRLRPRPWNPIADRAATSSCWGVGCLVSAKAPSDGKG